MASSRKPDDLSWDGLVRAGRVLFGARAEALLDGAAWRKELKRAFRRRALETHPDRARSLGRSEAELAREFRLVVEAYQLLVEMPEVAPGRPPPSRTAHPRPRASAPPRRSEPVRAARARGAARRAAGGPTPASVPPRGLRLGEYLYYSRKIPFEALIEAVAWQRAQRPRVGRIAVECGYLTHDQVLDVLERRRGAHELDVPFAEYATRIGLLTPFAKLAVLGRQGKLQRKIGRFFVERGWVTEEELAEARVELGRHNARHPAR